MQVGRSAKSIYYWILLYNFLVLHISGFEAYLVGGCVRDLVLKRIPKDFDVITTANLKQVWVTMFFFSFSFL